MTWSKLEEKAILAYAGRAVAEALAWRDGWKLVAEQEAFEAWVLEWRKSTWRPLPSDTRQDMPTHWNVNAVHHMRIAWEARAALSFGATQDSLPRAEKVGGCPAVSCRCPTYI